MWKHSTTTPQFCAHHGCAANDDGDDLGLIDPSLDKSLIVGEQDNGFDGTEESDELDTGNPIAMIRNIGSADSEAELELDMGALINEPAFTGSDDDQDGPLVDSELALESEQEGALGQPDDVDDAGEANDFTLDDLPELESREEATDDSEVEASTPPHDDASDYVVGWAAQPWSELKLRSTFVARRTLNARRNILIAAGDAIDFLSLEDFSPLDSQLPQVRAHYASFIDSSCRSVLIAKVTGQVVIWNRENGTFDVVENEPFAQIDRAAQVWCEPAGTRVWIRVADGRLLRSASNGHFEAVSIPGRCIAMYPNDQSTLCLVNQGKRLSLLTISLDDRVKQSVPEELVSLVSARDVMLVALEETIVVGARGHGLWISCDGGNTFRKAAGCRTVTAFTIGHHLGRDYAWASLFYELEDRTELVAIDLRTLRVQKLAEYRVMADSQGPEDDPPERARIDCLLWDSARHRVLAAGCFGLACFVPPQNPHADS